ncbi:MAG: hypothetical protein COU29_01675 [Candidatus Magasanikbacteria bacterium CG10_big_fil_rev_8_21_14_0_10_36_32]|uniref:Uncharacterized protein n=1 Tax=Candidatus Magasanikbacteria bacterium CG10_big_fil_rev_8_21_14_0_10_36_32 TaxID=1974646 RepID=A0A2M6W6R8_9BACT|nr:MAG: hypothetical protein COU29_01675 [Candidatus Magasanikbacteria bacterium CG10_big_fil_rev_8_21_14_0_10_36_32]
MSIVIKVDKKAPHKCGAEEPKEQRVKESKNIREQESAREYAEVGAPPARKPNRMGAHVPAAIEPVHIHSAKHPVDIENIENVRIAVGEKYARLAIWLDLQELIDAGHSNFDLSFAAEVINNFAIQRSRLTEVVVRMRNNQILYFFSLAVKPQLEVVADITELYCGVGQREIVGDNELIDSGFQKSIRILEELLKIGGRNSSGLHLPKKFLHLFETGL